MAAGESRCTAALSQVLFRRRLLAGAGHERSKSDKHTTGQAVESTHHAGAAQVIGEFFAAGCVDEIPSYLYDSECSKQDGELRQLCRFGVQELGEKITDCP